MIYGLSHKFDKLNNEEIINEIIKAVKEEESVFEIEYADYEEYYWNENGTIVYSKEDEITSSPAIKVTEDCVKAQLAMAINNNHTIYFNC